MIDSLLAEGSRSQFSAAAVIDGSPLRPHFVSSYQLDSGVWIYTDIQWIDAENEVTVSGRKANINYCCIIGYSSFLFSVWVSGWWH